MIDREESELFISALERGDLSTLKKISKADVHNHSILSAPLSVIESYTGKKYKPFPDNVSSIEEMDEYIFGIFDSTLFRREPVEFITEAGIKFAIDDGVKILEMSVDCSMIDFYPDKEKGLAEFLIRLKECYKEKIDFRPEVGIMRNAPMKDIERWIFPCVETGVFKSIDIYDVEDCKPPESFKKIYKRAKNLGMKLKAHVGEFCSAEVVRKTVEVLELDEVQHGITVADSEDVMRWLANNKIRLNICPTSNVKLKRVPSLKDHPIRKIFDAGVSVTINTDDVFLFSQSVSDEYLALYKAGVLEAAELDKIRVDSLK